MKANQDRLSFKLLKILNFYFKIKLSNFLLEFEYSFLIYYIINKNIKIIKLG